MQKKIVEGVEITPEGFVIFSNQYKDGSSSNGGYKMNRKTPLLKNLKMLLLVFSKVRYLSLSKLILVFILFMLKKSKDKKLNYVIYY
jgi:hypothetical protein